MALFALLLVALALAGAHPREAVAHPELERAEPPPDGLLGAPPRQLDLWLSETVDHGAGSPTLQLLDEDGREVRLGELSVAADDPRHVRAEFSEPVGFGTYTVVWSARSGDDGHTLSGSYAFRVGSGRAPGAATVQGELPRPWAVVTRWLTFLGAALAASGFLFGPVVLGGRASGDDAARRRANAVVAGAAVALLASVAEPVLQTLAPVGGAARPGLADAVWGLPRGWWLRPIGSLAAIGCGLVLLRAARRERPTSDALQIAGAALSLVALLGLSFTSHAAARSDWRGPAVASNALHGWSVALWVGGLAHLALSRRGLNRDDELKGDDAVAVLDPVRRFSRLALGLVAVGVVTGAVNAGLVLPAVRSLWRTTYGDILLLKVAVLVPALALATFHRTALRRALARARDLFRTTIRVEAALVLLVAAGGSLLALSAAPVVRAGNARLVDLEVPVAAEPGRDLSVRLQVEPARPGENRVWLLVADANGAPLGADQLLVPPLLDFVSLNESVEQRAVSTAADGAGAFAVDGVQLSLDGWWRVEATIARMGRPVTRMPFYLMLPDPNVNGQNAPPIPDASTEARALFERGLVGLTSPRSMRFDQRLSGGTGTAVESSHAVTAGGEGRPPASSLFAAEFEAVTVGEVQWVRQPGLNWTEREAVPVFLPSDWGEDYVDATGFRLGRIEEVEGERCQFVSFVVPATGDRSAWYGWWVGLESGRVRRETMVARGHYMVYRFYEFDAPFTIEPPADAASGTPAAIPAATPETRP